MSRSPDALEGLAREMCAAAGMEPDSRIPMPGTARTMPASSFFREAARAEQAARDASSDAQSAGVNRPQSAEFQKRPLRVFGEHSKATLAVR